MIHRLTLAAALCGVLALPCLSSASAETPGWAPGAEKSSVAASVTARELFTFKDRRITESSDIETAANFRRIIYTHNDSGDDARFFAVGPGGGTRAVYTLQGAGSWDWEDMSAGPRRSLWFGDFGANQLGRDFISVFRVREPQRLRTRSIAWRQYDFVYADGQSHNAEALLVNPVNGDLFVVTKQTSGAGIYRAPRRLSTTGKNVLRRVASAPAVVTGGSFSPNGKRLVLRTYSKAYFYHRIGGRVTTEIRLPIGGESVAFARHQAGIVVGKEGLHSPVWRVVVRR